MLWDILVCSFAGFYLVDDIRFFYKWVLQASWGVPAEAHKNCHEAWGGCHRSEPYRVAVWPAGGISSVDSSSGFSLPSCHNIKVFIVLLGSDRCCCAFPDLLYCPSPCSQLPPSREEPRLAGCGMLFLALTDVM